MAKPRRKQAVRGNQGKPAMPAWVWLFTGILIGLVFSLAWILREGWPENGPRANAQATPAAASEDAIADLAVGESAAPRKPHFEFYSVLPEMEVVIPNAEIQQQSRTPPTAPTDNSKLLVQLGSFGNRADADALKAQVALMGVQAKIQPVTINGKDWFRVRVGPLADAREVERVRGQLGQFADQAITLKVKG